MPRPPGRDQSAPMERLVRLLGALTQHPAGATTEVMLRALGGAQADDARRKMLSRDIEALNALGYDIRNIADPGDEGVYVVRARDNRLQVHLSAEQRGELLRAAIAAGLEGMRAHLGDDAGGPDGARSPGAGPAGCGSGALPATGDTLDLVQRGVTGRCRMRFDYKGQPRVVHPRRVHSGPSGWYLSGREEGQAVVKEFVVFRMGPVTLDAPGSAEPVREEPRPSLDPLTWLQDPPTTVVVAVPAEHRLLAENLLGRASQVSEHAGALHLRYVVTHRAVFRWRLYELGTRVRVLSPPEVRAEILDELGSFLAGAR